MMYELATSHELWRKIVNRLERVQEETGQPVPCWPSPPDKRDFAYRAFAGTQELPRAFIRKHEVPPIRNQGRFGACTGFSSWGVKEWQERQQGDCPPQGLSPRFIYVVSKQIDGLKGQAGTYPRVTLKVLQDYGTCPEDVFPYSEMDSDTNPAPPPQRAYDLAKEFRISNYARLYTVEEMKRAIVEQGPIKAALWVTESFVQAGKYIPLPEGRVYGGHDTYLCGYDDTLKLGGFTGFFLLVNSWGTSWGDGGFSWLPYEFVTYKTLDGIPAFFEAWTCIDLPYQLKQAKQIVLKVGSQVAYVDGQKISLDVAPTVQYGRTLLPIRFIAENLGCLVNWQPETGVVEIRRPS